MSLNNDMLNVIEGIFKEKKAIFYNNFGNKCDMGTLWKNKFRSRKLTMLKRARHVYQSFINLLLFLFKIDITFTI